MLFLIFIINFLMVMATMFLFMTHPLALGLSLMLQVLLSSLIVGMNSMSTWFAYILFLVFIGGVLVLFLYVTSLANNELLKVSPLSLCFASFLIFLASLIMYISQTFNIDYSLHYFNNKSNFYSLKTISSLYEIPFNWTVLFLTCYLLLALTVVAKIIDITSGPLRSNNYV